MVSECSNVSTYVFSLRTNLKENSDQTDAMTYKNAFRRGQSASMSGVHGGGRPIWWWLSIIGSFVGVIVLVLINIFIFPYNNPKYLQSKGARSKTNLGCSWKIGGPTIFNMKTSLGVSYEAGHWFHMAENFMVHHSTLRALQLQANSSEIFFNFDKSIHNAFCFLVWSNCNFNPQHFFIQ